MNFEPSLGYARPSKAFINIKLKTQNPVDGRQSAESFPTFVSLQNWGKSWLGKMSEGKGGNSKLRKWPRGPASQTPDSGCLAENCG